MDIVEGTVDHYLYRAIHLDLIINQGFDHEAANETAHAILDAIAPFLVGAPWKTIESAPANTYVLTCRIGNASNHLLGLLCGYAEPPETAFLDESLGWLLPQRPHDEWRPTHWMPLMAAAELP